MKRVGIRSWLLLAFLMLTLLPLISAGMFFLRVYENALRETVTASLVQIADKKFDQIDSFLQERHADIELLSGRSVVVEAIEELSTLWKREGFDTEAYRHLLASFDERLRPSVESGDYYDLLLIDLNGNVIYSMARESDLGSNLITGPYRVSNLAEGYDEALNLLQVNQTAFAPYLPSHNRVASFLVAPVLQKGRLVGAVALQFNQDRLEAVVTDRTGLGAGGETVLAQRQGDDVLFTGPLRHIENAAYRHRVPLNRAAYPIKHALFGQSGQGLFVDYAGYPVVAAWHYLPALRWGMVVKIDVDEAFAPLVRMQRITFSTLTIVALAISLLALYFGKALAAPLQRLTEVTTRVTDGDFGIATEASGPRELCELAASFNRMSANLSELYAGLLAEVLERNREIEVRKDTEALLARARDSAESANRAKSIFLANMSHELRTPLNAILGFAQLMERDERLPSDVLHNLEIINRSGRHLLALINDVLEISRIESGRTTVQNAAFDLNDMLISIEEMIRPRAEHKGLSFAIEHDGQLPSYVYGDANHLRQVLINLLGNAVKYTDHGGFGLCLTPLEDCLRFDVADTGPGIAAEDQSRIFQPFFQTEFGIAKGEGTGLGLAISHEFVRIMGGELVVESEPGKGSVFSFCLPLPEVEATAVETRQRRIIGLELGHAVVRILVAEDNPDNQELIVSLLRQAGFAVRMAENGQRAVEIFQTWLPHFIWMDMRMPVLDGYQATQRIRALPGGDKVKIVALTASAFHEDRAAILAAGCDDMLAKPIDQSRLYLLMGELLGLRYRYADTPLDNRPKTEIAVPASSSLLALPESLRNELYAAAEQLDPDAMRAIVDGMLVDYPDIARMISDWINEYRFDKVIELCRQSEEENK